MSLAEFVQLKRAEEQANSATTKAAIKWERSEEAFRSYGARNYGKGREQLDLFGHG